jgi:hypothetical protein
LLADPVALDPPLVVTITDTMPAAPVGLTTVRLVVDDADTVVPAVPPKVTDVAPTTKFAPVTATTAPPAVVPASGLIAVTVGTPAA